jgi:hypothetical protein
VSFIDGNCSRIIPKKTVREQIIREAHHWGHFQVGTTVERIKEKNVWPSLEKDFAQFSQNCKECQRHQKHQKLKHAAKAITVSGIFDRIQIDFI